MSGKMFVGNSKPENKSLQIHEVENGFHIIVHEEKYENRSFVCSTITELGEIVCKIMLNTIDDEEEDSGAVVRL